MIENLVEVYCCPICSKIPTITRKTKFIKMGSGVEQLYYYHLQCCNIEEDCPTDWNETVEHIRLHQDIEYYEKKLQ